MAPQSTNEIVAIVADDLTGATDSAVQFSRENWTALLLLNEPDFPLPAPVDCGLLLAVTADNRAMPDDAAARGSANAVDLVLRQGARKLFVKIDSTMRGSVAAQLAGALEGWSRHEEHSIAVVCPAYPSMGRTVVRNTLLVGGTPVSETPIGIDPVTPVLSSDLGVLIPGSVPLSTLGAATIADAVDEALRIRASGGPAVFTVDANTDEELADVAQAVAERPGVVIPVGSAGLAMAIARRWHYATTGASRPAAIRPKAHRRVLVQVSSLNVVSKRQLDRLRASIASDRFLEFSPDVATASSEQAMTAWSATQPRDFRDVDVVVVSAPEQRAESSGTQGAQEIAANLSKLTASLLLTGQFGAIGFVGGDGARAALSELGVSTVRVLDSLEEGIPVSSTVDGLVPGTIIFTKAGGFGDADSLVNAVARVGHHHARSINV